MPKDYGVGKENKNKNIDIVKLILKCDVISYSRISFINLVMTIRNLNMSALF